MKLYAKKMKSPVGELSLLADERSLIAVLWENDDPSRVRLEKIETSPAHPVLRDCESQLEEYFEGKRRIFELPLNPRGTEFQRRVWKGLTEIPYGSTFNYGQLAVKVGSPSAARAVGAANGRNPISIVVPCHRVIGASGKLVGFAGGLEAKAYLLELERSKI